MSKNGKTLQEILIEQNEKEKNGNQSKFQLVKEQIGKKAKIVVETVKKHPKKILSGIGALIIVSSIVSCAAKNNNNNNNNNNVIGNVQTTTSTTTRPQPTEKEEIVVTTTAATTTSKPAVTTEPEVIEDETIEVTTVVTTTVTEPEIIEDEEIIVTKATTTEKEPVEEKEEEIVVTTAATTKATTKATAQTTTTTTTKATTSKVEEQKEPVVIEQAEPIQIKDFEKKVKLLKEASTKAGIYTSDEIIENTVRILHSDFIAHDDFEEITAVKLEQSLSYLASIGSVNNVTYNAGYMGYIPEITEGIYIPAEVCPESSQKFVEATIKLAESYRLGLNKTTPVVLVELTAEDEMKIQEEVMKELDKLNIIDDELYSQQFSNLYTEKWLEVYNKKVEENQKVHDKEVQSTYKELYKTALELVNSKEYEKLTPSEKIIVFTNISGALTSGMQQKHIDKYMDFNNGITSSIDEAREIMVKANEMNIDQQEALDKIVEENKPVVKQEREDLKNIVDELEKLHEEGKLLVR